LNRNFICKGILFTITTGLKISILKIGIPELLDVPVVATMRVEDIYV
jgi:hypothetical protein